MDQIDLTKCRGKYKCKITEIKRKKGGEYYIAEIEFPNDKKVTIDMQLIEALYFKLHKAMIKDEEIEFEPLEIFHDGLTEIVTSPFIRDMMLDQI